MPFVQIFALEGRTADQKRELVRAVTRSVCEATPSGSSGIRSSRCARAAAATAVQVAGVCARRR